MTSVDSQASTQSSDQHWAAKYIGLPWENGAQGPESYDCWGFFRHVQRTYFSTEVPFINVDADDLRQVIKNFTKHDEVTRWQKVTKPASGDAVLMRHSKFPSHVGVWLDVDSGGVLHCVRGEGVVFSSITALKFSGWGHIEFFKHESNT